ncbi:MAG: helix-turn-helix transcriptional regulator [Clostridia bacterium]|nr:helix-turn-helix transcriptional regulator [Clostridia bacterium]
MEYVIEKILKILEENNITVYSLAKSSGISQSTLHMILHFKRTMQPKHFYTILENLPISRSAKNELKVLFQMYSLGHCKYSANTIILDMLKIFSDYTYGSSESTLLNTPPDTDNTLRLNTIYNNFNIQPVISQLIIKEMKKQSPKAYVYVPMMDAFLNTYIDSVVKQYKTDIKITLFIDLLNTSAETNDNYNLKIFKNILPLALSYSDNYEFYYTYVNSIIDESYLTPYPYFIALSDVIIFVSADFNEIMLINNRIVTEKVHRLCEGMLQKYKKLLEVSANVPNIVETLVQNQNDCTTHLCIEYEPCFSMHFTEEMINAVIPEGVFMREQLVGLLNIRLAQLKKINTSIQIFNKNCLMEFAKTGIIQEFPKGYSRPCTKEERLFILKSLLKYANSNNHNIQAINPVNLNISDCLSLIVQNDSCLQFTIWNDTKLRLKYFATTQYSICRHFYDFIKDIVNTDYLYSQKATVSFIEQAIQYVENIEE